MIRKIAALRLFPVLAFLSLLVSAASPSHAEGSRKDSDTLFAPTEGRATLSGVFTRNQTRTGKTRTVIRLTINAVNPQDKAGIVEAEVQYAEVAPHIVPEQKENPLTHSEKQELKWGAIPWGRKYPVTAYCSTEAPSLETTIKNAQGKNVKRRINVNFPASERQKYSEIVPYLYFRLCHTADYRNANVTITSKRTGLGYRYAGSATKFVKPMGAIPSGALKKFESLTHKSELRG